MRVVVVWVCAAALGCSGDDFGASPMVSGGLDSGALSAGSGGLAGGPTGGHGATPSGGSSGAVGAPDAGGSSGGSEPAGGPEAGPGGGDGGMPGVDAGGAAGEGGAGGTSTPDPEPQPEAGPKCQAGYKWCSDECVLIEFPQGFGCSPDSCERCDWSDNISGGSVVCESGACKAVCPEGWQAREDQTGCELVPCGTNEKRCSSTGPCEEQSIINGCGDQTSCQACPNIASACCIDGRCGSIDGTGACL